ncbi:MAG: FMN-binding protein [Pseudomonadales bacterium]|nr:FMN-binding protein [Pseudomonadales bacterium]
MTVAAAPAPVPLRRYAVLVALSLACGALLAGAAALTRPAIERQQAERLEAALTRVLPEATRFEPRGAGEPAAVFAGRTADGRLAGYALRGAAMGYADRIEVLYGWDPERAVVTGLVVLDQRETPGLGSRIRDDAAFHASIRGLPLALAEDRRTLRTPVALADRRGGNGAGRIDGITGATISSVAVARAIEDSAARWLPELVVGEEAP